MYSSLQQAINALHQALQSLQQDPDARDRDLVQRTVTLAPGNFSPVSWLAAHPRLAKCFWAPRNQQLQVAALGIARASAFEAQRPLDSQVADCEHWLAEAEPDTSILGGVAFDIEQPQWHDFGPGRFILPRIELTAFASHWQLRCNLCPRSNGGLQAEVRQSLRMLSHVVANPLLLPRIQPALHGIDFNPSREQWYRMVNLALEREREGELAKVVLSREGRLQFAAPFDPWPLLQGWRKSAPHTYSFAFQFAPGHCFMGCSPEMLFERQQDSLHTEALAGTTARSNNLRRDQARADALLHDSKNLLENNLVYQDIEHRLAPLCTRVVPAGGLSIVKLRRVQHLRMRIHGDLKAGIRNGQLIEALHPTPAVGGMPRQAAKAFIEANETYPRGWYAGACGRITPDDADFTVAIRSCRIDQDHVHVFSGAGIVPGSDPGEEWLELGNKLSNLFTLLVS